MMSSLLRVLPPHVDNPVGLSPMPYSMQVPLGPHRPLMVMGSLLRVLPPHVDNPVELSLMPYCCGQHGSQDVTVFLVAHLFVRELRAAALGGSHYGR